MNFYLPIKEKETLQPIQLYLELPLPEIPHEYEDKEDNKKYEMIIIQIT